MISLSTSDTAIRAELRGTIKYMSFTQVADPWVPLSGGWLSVSENPILFNMFLYRFGNQNAGGQAMFRLPNWNNSGRPRFFKAWRVGDTRNVPLTEGGWGQAPHNHSGTCTPGGSHDHESPGSSIMSGATGTHYDAYGNMASGLFLTNGPWMHLGLESEVGKHRHTHGGGTTTSGAQIPAENKGSRVEPINYGVMACIHKG